MKKGFSRLIAIALLLCLMSTFIVPATSVSAVGANNVVETYDFILYNAQQDDGYNSIFLKDGVPSRKTMENDCSCGCEKKVREHLVDSYEKQKWLYLESSFAASGLQFREEYDFCLRSKESTKSGWAAFKIAVPEAGTFNLRYTSWDGVATVEAYIFTEAELAATANGTVAELMDAEDVANRSLGQVSVAEAQDSGDFNAYTFDQAGDYIVVLKHVDVTTLFISELALISRSAPSEPSQPAADSVSPIVVVDSVIPVTDPNVTCLITQVKGHDYYILPLEGKVCLVYDLDTTELVAKFNTGYSKTLDVIEDENGVIWLSGGSRHLTRYDPVTNVAIQTANFKDLPGLEGASAVYSLAAGDNGDIYMGCNGGVLAVYNENTKQYRSLGKMNEAGGYLYGLTRIGDYLYFSITLTGTNKESHVYKYNIVTEQLVGKTDITHLVTATYLQSLNVMGNGELLVFGGNSGAQKNFIAIDPDTMELVDIDMPSGANLYVSGEYKGKQYLRLSNGDMYEYDIAAKTFSKVEGMPSGLGFRSRGSQEITLDGVTYLMTYSNTGAAPRLYNIEAKEYTEWNDLVNDGGGTAYCRSIINGEKGSNELYFGAFNTEDCAIFNTETGKITGYYKTGGQGDSALWYNGKLYYGNYSSTTLNEILLEGKSETFPASNQLIQLWKLDHAETGQKRIHTLSGGDGYVFAGTLPDQNLYGGAVVVYNTSTGEWYYERHVVQDQAIIDVEYSNKLLFGSTSVFGGSKAAPLDPTTSAVIFVYDYENRQKIATLDPRDYIEGLASPVTYISGLSADPVVDGRFWAVVSETLFAFTFDRETLTFNVQEVISFDKSQFSTSASRVTNSREVRFDVGRNLLYYSFDSYGGFQAIELADWNAEVGSIQVVKNQKLMNNVPLKYAITEDGGELYFSEDPGNLTMLPLNVTDEDKAIAGAVSEMITAIGTVTVDSEDAVKAARAAYENLSWRHKALVEELELLEDCEAALLESKIDAISGVSASSLPMLTKMMEEYNSMTERQKQNVKNFAALQAAYEMADMLNRYPDGDEGAAAAVAELIDKIGEVTLDSVGAITKARNAYNLLSDAQKAQVNNVDKLIAAEAKLAELKEAADKVVAEAVQNQIDAIGEVTLESEEAINTARAAYDALTDAQKALVTNLDVLTAAESKLAELKAAEEKDPGFYDFGLYANPDFTNALPELGDTTDTPISSACNCGCGKTVEEHMKAAYPDTLNWKLYAYSTADNSYFSNHKDGYLKVNGFPAGGWFATQMDAPEPGIYDFAISVSGNGAATAKFHLIPMTGDMTREDIEKAVASGEYLLATEAVTGGYAKKELQIEADEYLLVLVNGHPSNVRRYNYVSLSLTPFVDPADKAAAEAVQNQIDAIGEVTLESEEAINTARAAYDALTDAQKALVTNLDVLTAAEAKLSELKAAEKEAADKAAAEAVKTLIDAIGEVTLNSEEAINAARTAYDALTTDQKALVDAAKLTAAESKLAELKAAAEKAAADKAAADAVTAKIEAIGEVTLESEEDIKAAREAYDALTADQKALVDAAKLTAAEAKLAELKAAAEKAAADKAAADAVTAKIEAIGKVTLKSEADIKAAREAYDALTADQKALVDAAKLTAAEAALEALKKPADSENPKTGDETNLVLPVVLMVVSVMGIAAGAVCTKKFSYKGKHLK